MRILLRDLDRRPVGRVDVDADTRPSRVTVPDTDREVFLTWDSAIDDGGGLRRCVRCGCSDLFHEKAFPIITGFVVVLAFAGAAVALLGFATDPSVQIVLTVVLVLDVAILALSRRRIVCYRCHSAYPGQRIARYLRSWDRSVADRYPKPRPAATSAEASTNDGSPNDARGRELPSGRGRRILARLRRATGRPGPPTSPAGSPSPAASATMERR
ncbi:MAG: hypothetical protein AB8G96_12090 [Phycisphaerales bacterium]